MSKVHELDLMSTNCARVVIAFKYFLWTELQNVSSFKRKKICHKFSVFFTNLNHRVFI